MRGSYSKKDNRTPIDRRYGDFTGSAPPVQHGAVTNRVVIPSRDNMRIWENCFTAATLMVGYKSRHLLYNIRGTAERTKSTTSKLMECLFMRYYQDGDHMAMLRVSYHLEVAVNVLKGMKGSFDLNKLVDMAFALSMGDPTLADPETEH
jgi:hypothetical protein